MAKSATTNRHMTYRQLLEWMRADARKRSAATLDDPITVRIQTADDGPLVCGAVSSASVDAGCKEQEGLVLDCDQGPDDDAGIDDDGDEDDTRQVH